MMPSGRYVPDSLNVTERLGVVGVITLELRDEDGALVESRTNKNLVTTAGLSALASALNWSGIEDQAANLGLNTPYSLAPVYGAVGTGTVPVTAIDTALTAELARGPVSQASAGNGQTAWSFFFGSSQAVGTISEAGAFASAGVTPGSGILIDHVIISPALVKTATQTMTMQVSFTLASA